MATIRMTSEQARKFRLTRYQKARLDRLTDAEITAAAKADPDNRPLTKKEFATIAKIKRGRGRPPKGEGERKERVTLRLDPDVLASYRATGSGWQTRINDTLRSGHAGERRAKRVKRK